MRSIKRPPLEVFNLSFLDIVSCAFGAVVMLVLLAKNGEQDQQQASADLSILVDQVLAARQSVDELSGGLSDQEEQLRKELAKAASVTQEQKNLESSVPRAQQTIMQLKDEARSLREAIRRENARLSVPESTQEPDEEVGGIPTDAEYVIFVIDNSGSMSSGSGWQRVTAVVNDILKNHPDMRGFQIMAADGDFMYQGQEGKWLPDTTSMRQKAMARMAQFRGGASAPEKGMSRALQLYGNTKGKVSMYVFGDDYRPSNLDPIVRDITSKNADARGEPRFRIHGVGFFRPRKGNGGRFAAFMQAIAERNRGAFIGLDF